MTIDDIFPDPDYWDNELYKVLGPIILRQLAKGMLAAGAEIGVTLNPNVVVGQVADYVRDYSKLAVRSINNTTREKLRGALSDIIENGGDRQSLIGKVGDILGADVSKYRAELVARTELARAHSSGRLEQYKESGATRKVWAAGVEACEFCRELDGLTMGVEENFFDKGTQLTITAEDGNEKHMSLDYEDVATQPLHPGCNCDTRFEWD
jgi:hypothetical protein